MTEAIDSILEGAQLAFTGIEPKVKPFPTGPLLTLLHDSHESEAKQRALALQVRPCRALVLSDPALLTGVLDNLLGNAIKYTERGGVLVGSRRRRDKLIVQVWDTGVGIPPGLLDAIFEEYRRLIPEGRPGFGLGLAMVKRTCDLLGHAVGVRSVPGKGSCFSVDFRWRRRRRSSPIIERRDPAHHEAASPTLDRDVSETARPPRRTRAGRKRDEQRSLSRRLFSADIVHMEAYFSKTGASIDAATNIYL